MDDKTLELQRYEERARRALNADRMSVPRFGAAALAPIFRAPYLHYEALIRETVLPEDRVMELGAGAGIHTDVLLRTRARVTATDISPASLALLERNLSVIALGHLATRVADMEQLPFDPASFDVVACAGSLSYGDPHAVDAEVRRVLRPGGTFICIDSLNHNLIYRLNRRIQYERGRRSKSTLERMPNAARIEQFPQHYASVEVRYFGGLTWGMPALAKLIGDERASVLSDTLDQFLNVRNSAFKFVLVARGRL